MSDTQRRIEERRIELGQRRSDADAAESLRQQLTAAQSDNEALRARVAELESGLSKIEHCNYDCGNGLTAIDAAGWMQGKAIELLSGSNNAWLVRQHAEALVVQAREWNPEEQTYSGRKPHKELIAEAQRLLQQADEIEKAGGGDAHNN